MKNSTRTKSHFKTGIIKSGCLMVLWIFHLPATTAQQVKVERISLSTRAYDEVSPVFYKEGLIFCTNRPGNSLAGYRNGDNSLYKLFYSAPSVNGWKIPVLFFPGKLPPALMRAL